MMPWESWSQDWDTLGAMVLPKVAKFGFCNGQILEVGKYSPCQLASKFQSYLV